MIGWLRAFAHSTVLILRWLALLVVGGAWCTGCHTLLWWGGWRRPWVLTCPRCGLLRGFRFEPGRIIPPAELLDDPADQVAGDGQGNKSDTEAIRAELPPELLGPPPGVFCWGCWAPAPAGTEPPPTFPRSSPDGSWWGALPGDPPGHERWWRYLCPHCARLPYLMPPFPPERGGPPS